MPNIKDVSSRIDANTDRLSTQVRSLSLGLLAFSGGLMVSALTGDRVKVLPQWLLNRLFGIGILALLSLPMKHRVSTKMHRNVSTLDLKLILLRLKDLVV